MYDGDSDEEDDENDDGQIYEDDVHEMRAFMRMFMDLVGIFNDDQVAPDDGNIPGTYFFFLVIKCSLILHCVTFQHL